MKNRITIFMFLLVTIFLIVPSHLSAKALHSNTSTAVQSTQLALHSLQQKTLPYLQARASHASASTIRPLYIPTQNDYHVLMKNYSSLSADFLAVYHKAMALHAIYPAYLSFQSPGGHFDILYTTDNSTGSAVDPADEYGFSTADWRQRMAGPNGVPDYIDEVAWACDSAWGMEIDRFGFHEPYAYRDSLFGSYRYKIVVTYISPDDYYGQTIFYDSLITAGHPGFSSYIELRNSWPADVWNVNAIINYHDHPINAVRITCAHEFFHAVQYAMAWQVVNNVYIDNFPVAWLEGTAVLMEESAFDSINDYTQYLDEFFNHPDYSFLSDNYYVYKNSILAKYLYERIGPASSINFIKTVYQTNYNSSTPFATNLVSTATTMDTSWNGIVGNFFTGSFFTGSRAVLPVFIMDAPILGTWNINFNNSSPTTTKTIKPVSMANFGRARTIIDKDTLTISCRVVPQGQTANTSWSMHVITLSHTPALSCSTISVQKSDAQNARITLSQWKNIDTAVAIISNADLNVSFSATVGFDVDLVAASIKVFPNPVFLHRNKELFFSGGGISSVNIYSLNGTRIKTVLPKDNSELVRECSWNASADHLAPGTYYARINTEAGFTSTRSTYTRKILVLP